MRKIGVCGLLVAIGMMAPAGDAFAVNQVPIDCSMNVNALDTEIGLTHPGGLAGADYQITGPCNLSASSPIRNDDIIIVPINGMVNNTINGSVNVIGARRLNLVNLLIDTGAHNTPVVSVAGPASVDIAGCTMQNSKTDGVQAHDGAAVTIAGTITMAGTTNSTVTGNGRFGVNAFGGATVTLTGVTVSGNTLGQVFVDQNSTVSMKPGGGASAVDIDSSAVATPAIAALQSSSVTLSGATVNGPSANHTILIAQGSNAILNGSTVTANTPFSGMNPLAVITATGSSSVALAGGNTITNSASPGAALIVSDGSSFIDVDGTRFGFASGLDTINGDGRIFTQSVIELATASMVGVNWTGNISAFAASSFRSDGGSVTISGTVTLDQAANGYFNHQNGTTNSITSVVCNSTTDHVTNPTFVTPNIMIGTAPKCATF